MLKKIRTLPILVFTLLAVPLQAIGQTQQANPANPPSPDYYWRPGPGHMMWDGGYWGSGYAGPYWGMFPMFLVIAILLCVIVFYIARVTSGSGHHQWASPQSWGDPTHSALQILNERFAKGEIQKAEYEEKKTAILSGARR